jgi:hypothetical protein
MIRLLEKSRGSPRQSLLHKLGNADLPGQTTEPDAILRCTACGQAVTSNHYRIEVEGASEHVYTNPQGFRFHIVCFREAAGCLCEGEPTPIHSWFTGYDWCYALCLSCRAHLGWHYAGGDRFYGLIRDRLVESPSTRHRG